VAQAPAWLFSFVDLAFLLLIAMTQIGGNAEEAPVFGEVVVPRVEEDGEATRELPAGAADRWQLRVHPAADDAPPYELARPAAEPPAEGLRLDAAELREQLGALRDASQEKPILSPHADSRSEDLLEAVVQLEERWPGRRRATVLPGLPRP